MHPLYSRITGQVIWLLFEENDARPDDIDAFMDLFLKRKQRDLETMQVLLDNPAMYLQVQLQDIPCLQKTHATNLNKTLPPPCLRCAALDGHVLPASHPDLISLMPPFALGCHCTPKAITAQQAATAPLLTEAPPPQRKLYCDTGWLFHMYWATVTP